MRPPLSKRWSYTRVIGNQAKKAYKREVRANCRAPRHDRIVPLLAAFKHREKFHLILPWARGGNLADLFQNYATSTETKTEEQQVADWYSERWLLAQCLGLADGLAAVHRTSDNPPTSAQIHADIKPENILCFALGEADHGPFDLKLADFGEAQEVDPETNTVPVKRVPHTKTYRPPEHDTDDILHLNYDVWCLACVFIELLTWAIAGSEAADKFELGRLAERDERKATTAGGNVFADTFFKKVSTRLKHRLEPQIRIIHTSKTADGEDKEDAEDAVVKTQVIQVSTPAFTSRYIK
ncbi:hypothetical protein PFICI_01033 [Pestalotiopsis fici W106-1]|uniref:Protein kinase domain-containing protein n=1 Tax=Pestalotiopsis fici (strain W106-1 / CGMCC3.15140) TaxID=1229662 RepID=W3XML9_PESFW|nr:uncharacterized protein PFICI_01033 [Pestalotiopsis fici W106-1]ETS87205.1 hypothetical protein PFICI_01033 [Pestalotiopsis fici W106-1]